MADPVILAFVDEVSRLIACSDLRDAVRAAGAYVGVVGLEGEERGRIRWGSQSGVVLVACHPDDVAEAEALVVAMKGDAK